MTQDPLQHLRGDAQAREVFEAMGKAFEGMSIDTIIAACMNMIANCIRQNYGTRLEAESRMADICGAMLQMLMEHYDSTTGRRRSVVPFNQVVSPSRVESDFRVLGLGGKGNGRS